MNIKSIEIKRVTKNPFAGLCDIEGEFLPYYSCKIITDNGNAHGKGDTAEQAEQEAFELLKSREAQKVADVYSKFLSDNGVNFIDC